MEITSTTTPPARFGIHLTSEDEVEIRCNYFRLHPPMPGGADWQEFCDVRKLSPLRTIRKWRNEATWDEDECWPAHEWVETRSQRTMRETLHALPPSEFRTKQLRYLDDAYSAKTIEGELWNPPAPPVLDASEASVPTAPSVPTPINKADLIQAWSDTNFIFRSPQATEPTTELAILKHKIDLERNYDKSGPIFPADLAKAIPQQCSLREDWLAPERDLKGKRVEESGLYSYEPTRDELESWKKQYGRQINGVWRFKPRAYEDDHFQAHQWSHKLPMRKEAPLPAETVDEYSAEELSEEEKTSPIEVSKSRAPWKSRVWSIENDGWNPQEARALAKFEQLNASEIYKLPVRLVTILEEFSVRLYGRNLELKLYDSATVILPLAPPNPQPSVLPKCEHGVYNHSFSNCRIKSRHNAAAFCSWCKPVYPLYNERGEVFVSKPIRTDKALLNGDVHWFKLEPAGFEQIEKDTKTKDALMKKERKRQLKLAKSNAGKKVLRVLNSVQEFDTQFRAGQIADDEGGTGFYHYEGSVVLDHEANGYNEKLSSLLTICSEMEREDLENFIQGNTALYLDALRQGPVQEFERAMGKPIGSLKKAWDRRLKEGKKVLEQAELGEPPELMDYFEQMPKEDYVAFVRRGGAYLFYRNRKIKNPLVYLGPLGALGSEADWSIKQLIASEYHRLLRTAEKNARARSPQAKRAVLDRANKLWDTVDFYAWYPSPEYTDPTLDLVPTRTKALKITE